MPLFRRRAHAQYTGFERRPMVPKWSSPPARNTAEWIEAFGKSPRLGVVERIASDLSFATGKLYAIDRDGEEREILTHPFLRFMAEPNPLHEMTSTAIWRLFGIYQLLKGEAYCVIERDNNGLPMELWPVPTQWVTATPYADHPYYEVSVYTGGMLRVSVDDMFVMKDLNPLNPYRRGIGQAEAVSDEVEIDEYAAKFQKRFFYNDATPNLIVAMPNSSEDQRKRFRQEWKERFQGVLNAFGVATVGGDMSVQKIGENMKDMDMINGRTFIRNAVLEHFGVPREIMGITESSNRATSEAAQYIYAVNVLTPQLRRRQDAINQQLVNEFGSGLEWRFDEVIPKNQEFDLNKATACYTAGIITKNESRELVDLPPVPDGGDVFKTTFSDVFVGVDEDPVQVSGALMQAEGAPPPEDVQATDEISIDGMTDDDPDEITIDGLGKSRAIKARRASAATRSRIAQTMIAQAAAPMTREFQRAVELFFTGERDRIADALGTTQKAARKGDLWEALKNYAATHGIADDMFIVLDESERKRLVADMVRDMVDWKGEAAALEKIFDPLWKLAYQKGADVEAEQMLDLAVQRPELVSTARILGGKRVKNIMDTTQASIARIISDGLENGTTTRELERSILEEMNTTAGRAHVIAVQECNTSLNAGNYDMARKAGKATKTWHITDPSKARPSHLRLDGVTVPIDGKFPNGCRHPCDPACSDPGEVVNCHCFLTYDGY